MKRLPQPAAAALLAVLLVLAAALPASLAFAQAQALSDPTPLVFKGPAEEARFHTLTRELRCVMCQNQSLADSDAPIAHDLRREVLSLMESGKTDAQIKQYLVQRYGEFVLYKPRVEERTWLLWFGPLLVLLAGATVLGLRLKRNRRQPIPDDDTQEW
jgi:cytochrome c-type biogenesis protein CcmH